MKDRSYQYDAGNNRDIVEVLDNRGERDETGGYSVRSNPLVVYEDHADIRPASSYEISRAATQSLSISHTIRMRMIPSAPLESFYLLRLKHEPRRVFAILGVFPAANRRARTYVIAAKEEPFKL